MLNPYLIHQLHLQREAELERRLVQERLVARATPATHVEVREHVAAALIALARRIDPGQPVTSRPRHAIHTL